jgi:gamma-glutamyltranspeptidase/glutathione hydrolase
MEELYRAGRHATSGFPRRAQSTVPFLARMANSTPSKSTLSPCHEPCHVNCSYQFFLAPPTISIKDHGIMRDQFSNTQQIRKPAVFSNGGIIAAQSRRAAEVGAVVLAAGGDCVDAVIATTFALGVLEPWMSGVGGGGAMVLYRAREDRYEVIDYGMRAPGGIRAEDYPLAGEAAASDIFPWLRVKDDRNLHGPSSIAVPGVVAGMEEAHRRHARLPWQQLLGPSIDLAGEGLLVDWWTTLMIASSAADLRRYPASAAAYLDDGLPPNAQWSIKSRVRLPQDRLKTTLSHLAKAGPRDFYQGDLARSIAADVQAGGGALSVEDLASFRAVGREALVIPYRGGRVYATPELTCGPTLAHTLRLLQQSLQPGRDGPDAAAMPRMRWRCNQPTGNACRTWAMPTAGEPWAPSIWRRPAPPIFRWWTARATWRR